MPAFASPMMRCLALAGGLALAASACASGRTAEPHTANLAFDREGRPVASVVLNDDSAFTFAVDTAAQTTVLGPALIEAMALRPDPERRAQIHGAGGVTTVPMYRLDSLELAGRRIEDGYYASVIARHDGESPGHVGIAGQDLFASGRLVLDFERGTLRFGGVGTGTSADAMPVEFRYGGFAIIDIEIDGVTTSALVDTGAAESFANHALLDALPASAEDLAPRTQASGVTQNQLALLDGYRADVAIGAVRLAGQPISFANSPIFNTFGVTDRPAIVLGMDVLGQLPGISLDYDAAQFAVLEGEGD